VFQRLLEIAGTRLYLLKHFHVLDGDHRLVGEGFQKIDLALRERAFGSPH